MAEERKVLTISIDIGDFIGKCPICLCSIDSDNENYETYVVNAAVRFKKYSLPLCYDCWCSQVESCAICLIPIDISYSTELGCTLMLKTTMNTEHDDGICESCAKTQS